MVCPALSKNRIRTENGFWNMVSDQKQTNFELKNAPFWPSHQIWFEAPCPFLKKRHYFQTILAGYTCILDHNNKRYWKHLYETEFRNIHSLCEKRILCLRTTATFHSILLTPKIITFNLVQSVVTRNVLKTHQTYKVATPPVKYRYISQVRSMFRTVFQKKYLIWVPSLNAGP